MWRSTAIPARRAASRLEPIAYVQRPKRVFDMKYQAATIATAAMITSTGMPAISRPPKSDCTDGGT